MKKINKKHYNFENISKFEVCDNSIQLKLIDYIEKEKVKPLLAKDEIENNSLNELSGSEWAMMSKSVLSFNGSITEKRKTHGAAYPLSLVSHFIKIYSKEGDTIFDPFAGVGTTLDAANILNRHSIGIELNQEFVNLFKLGIDPKDGILNENFKRIMILGSSLYIDKIIKNKSIDLIITSPPYSNLLNKIRNKFADKDFKGNKYRNQHRNLAKPYSKSVYDLGNIDYKSYLKSINEIFKKLYNISKEGAYNVWVVRDFRNIDENYPYVSLHLDIINIARITKWVLWDIVIWDQSNQRKLVCLGGKKSRRFYFNIGYSYILIFRKNMKGEEFV